MERLTPSFSKRLSDLGRTVKDPTVKLQDIPEFITHLPPPITPETRIIAICGCEDTDELYTPDDFEPAGDQQAKPDPEYTGTADPRCDGWFVSDFFYFMLLLRNTGAAAETWITTERPMDLVKRYGPYLHGNPYLERKVVLSEDLLLNKNLATENMLYTARGSLKSTLMAKLKSEATQAKVLGQRLLVLTFGHGFQETKGVWLGNDVLEIDEFKEAVGEDVTTTHLSTACFSGGWVIRQDLNTTMFAAASPSKVSLSWTASASMGRYCGGIYTSALVKAWRLEVEAAEQHETDPSSAQSIGTKTFAGFAKEIYNSLFKVDRFAKEHDIRFSAQDDNWGSDWATLSAFPLIDFKARSDSLETYATTADALSYLNRDPSIRTDDRSYQDAASTSTSGLRVRFGSRSSAVSHLRKQAEFYFKSFPGADNEAPNTTAHGILRSFLARKTKLNDTNLDAIDQLLTYRLSLSAMATELLEAAGIPRPDGLRRCNFDLEVFESRCSSDPEHIISEKYNHAIERIFSNVLPDPAPGTPQGRVWIKPRRYLAAAIACDAANRSAGDVEVAIAKLENVYKANFNDIKRHLERDVEVRGRKASIFNRLGKRLRDLSPQKPPDMRRNRAATVISQPGLSSPVTSPPKLHSPRRSLG